MYLRPLPPDYCPLEVAIEPKSRAQISSLIAALQRFAVEDPLFRFEIDLTTGHCRIRGASDLHLDGKLNDLINTQGIAVAIGAPQVSYRETMSQPFEAEYTHDNHAGPTWQFARVKLRFEPAAPGAGNTFENAASPDAVPLRFAPGVEKGVNAVLSSGPLVGFPMVDIRTTLLDGAFHYIDSSALAFEIAARAAFREGANRHNTVLLEPIARVEVVVVSEEYIGSIIGDLNSRRGTILEQRTMGSAILIDALAPVANLFNYHGSLAPMTNGQASARWQAVGLSELSVDGGPPIASAAGLRA